MGVESVDNYKEFLPFLGHLAFALIFFSFLVTKIFYLRIVAIFASLTSIVYNYHVLAEPLWVPIQWNILFILTNIFQIGLILWEKRNYTLKGYKAFLFNKLFNDLTTGEFEKLVKKGYLRTGLDGEVLIKENTVTDVLLVLYRGNVQIISQNTIIKEIGPGCFLGEMSFLTGEKTKATVKAHGEVKYFSWDKDNLKKMLYKNPKLMSSVQRALGRQLINSILHEKQVQPLELAS